MHALSAPGTRLRFTRRAIVTAVPSWLPVSLLLRPALRLLALSGVQVFGWGFGSPDAIASDGTHVWVANYDANSVTELSAKTGGLVKVISGSRYKFNGPAAIASDGTHVWVANYDGDSVTELSARTGGLVKVISGSRYKFNDPAAIASDGTHVWVANTLATRSPSSAPGPAASSR